MQSKDFILGILNINEIFYKRGLILYSDITGYGYGEQDPNPEPDPNPNPDPNQYCYNDFDCDDGNFCNGKETC